MKIITESYNDYEKILKDLKKMGTACAHYYERYKDKDGILQKCARFAIEISIRNITVDVVEYVIANKLNVVFSTDISAEECGGYDTYSYDINFIKTLVLHNLDVKYADKGKYTSLDILQSLKYPLENLKGLLELLLKEV